MEPSHREGSMLAYSEVAGRSLSLYPLVDVSVTYGNASEYSSATGIVRTSRR
ncbi:hypothetical protein D3C87_1347070 [compost metagenome]